MPEEEKEIWYVGYVRISPGKEPRKRVFVEERIGEMTSARASRERDSLAKKLGGAPDENGYTYTEFGLRMEVVP